MTAGGAMLDTTGLTIAGGPSVTTTGIDAGGSTITNVADGLVSPISMVAINGSQLFDLSQSLANNFGGGSVVNPDGTVSAHICHQQRYLQ